jgi:hypothetical protein
MILLEPTGVGIANLKTLLLCFENMSGLKINFDKSEVVVMGVTPAAQQRVANLLNCRHGKFPITYLGLLISDMPLRGADWGFLPEVVAHRVEPWQGLYLGAAGRLELTNSCLSSLPLFAMSMYLLHDRHPQGYGQAAFAILLGRRGGKTQVPHGGLGHGV